MSETLVIRRVIEAPRERVYLAWTTAEQLRMWWGPRGVTCIAAELDVRPGECLHAKEHRNRTCH